MDDSDLLDAYLDHRSEAAFAELVNRHLKLTYSAALRQLGDPPLAKDAVQMVFIALARKARSLRQSRPAMRYGTLQKIEDKLPLRR